MELAKFLPKTLNFKLGNLYFSPSYLQAGLILLLLFLLVLTIAQMRRHFINWSVKGAFFGLFWGFLLALIFEGFLIIGGRTAVTEIIGWKNAPKPLLTVLDMGRQKLTSVLGVSSEIPQSNAQTPANSTEVIKGFQSLPPHEAASVKRIICSP